MLVRDVSTLASMLRCQQAPHPAAMPRCRHWFGAQTLQPTLVQRLVLQNQTLVMVVVDATRKVDRQYNTMFVLEQLERAGTRCRSNASLHPQSLHGLRQSSAVEFLDNAASGGGGCCWCLLILVPILLVLILLHVRACVSLIPGIEPDQLLLVLNKVLVALFLPYPVADSCGRVLL